MDPRLCFHPDRGRRTSGRGAASGSLVVRPVDRVAFGAGPERLTIASPIRPQPTRVSKVGQPIDSLEEVESLVHPKALRVTPLKCDSIDCKSAQGNQFRDAAEPEFGVSVTASREHTQAGASVSRRCIRR